MTTRSTLTKLTLLTAALAAGMTMFAAGAGAFARGGGGQGPSPIARVTAVGGSTVLNGIKVPVKPIAVGPSGPAVRDHRGFKDAYADTITSTRPRITTRCFPYCPGAHLGDPPNRDHRHP